MSGRVEFGPPGLFLARIFPRMPNDFDAVDNIVMLWGPPEAGFDCGREDQNRFLYKRAWPDQQAQLSVTYLYYVKGIIAAYASVCMDALPLGRGERGRAVRYHDVASLKLVQLGVNLPFQSAGLGKFVVADVIVLARNQATRVGCRYVTLDAQPDLVRWYEDQGFKRNVLRQDQRIRDAIEHGRDAERIAVSMRFDLREARP
jgi:GNAT superfamily N-acetyltransferase